MSGDPRTAAATHRAIDAVWRIESAKIIATVTRMVRDVGLAEELAQDALVAALETWPGAGVPDNPGAWLMTDRQAPRARPDPPARTACAQGGRDHPRDRVAARGQHARPRCAARCGEGGRDRRRPAAARLHRLPSGALHRCPRRAHAAPAGRPDHGRDRARLPGAGGDDRAAHRARQAHADRSAGAVRGAARRRTRGAAGVGAGSPLSGLQRRVLGHGRRRLDAAGAVRGRVAARAGSWRNWCRGSPKSTAWSR